MRVSELAKELHTKSSELIKTANELNIKKNEKALRANSTIDDVQSNLISNAFKQTESVHQKNVSKTPMLDKYTTDLTEAALQDPSKYVAIGRDTEIVNVIDSLNRRTKNNPVLVGEAGVGKTAIVEGLAGLIAQQKVGDRLNHAHIRVLEIAALGQSNINQKFLQIIAETKATRGENILFIDEVHTIMGTDTTNGALDLGDVLKPAMGRGDIQLIGSTTLDEYDKFIERDPALERRFQQIAVKEPDRLTGITILRGIKSNYEQYHHLEYDDDALVTCVDLAIRYIPSRYLPDKAIDLMDTAGAVNARLHKTRVDAKDIALVVQKITGIPVTSILTDDSDRLMSLRKKLSTRVKGQQNAIDQVVDAVMISKAGLQDPNKPLSSFLFLGTTGTGKTALARALAKIMFDNEDSMVRFDMSEFSERSALDRFQTLLTDTIKQQPYCILLLDEIEKASTQVHDRCLQILDAGELRDKRGRSTDFRNCIVIMTTNLAAEAIKDKQVFQHQENESVRQQLAFEKNVNYELTNVFRPEFINRIEHKVVFNMLTNKIIREITVLNLNNLNSMLKKRGFELEYNDDLITYLADVGTDEDNGARPLARAIDAEIRAPLSILTMRLTRKNSDIHVLQARVEGEAAEYGDPKGNRTVRFFGIRK